MNNEFALLAVVRTEDNIGITTGVEGTDGYDLNGTSGLNDHAVKIYRNGYVFILRGGRLYTPQGQTIK